MSTEPLSSFRNNTLLWQSSTYHQDDACKNIFKGFAILGVYAAIATLPTMLLGAATLIESIVRFPISLIKECFSSKEDGVIQAFERFKISATMMTPFINFFYYFLELKTDLIKDPTLKAMLNDYRFSEAVIKASGNLSQVFYSVRPFELAMGMYDPKKLDDLTNKFKSAGTCIHSVVADFSTSYS